MQLSLRYQSLDLACRGADSLSDSSCYVLKKSPEIFWALIDIYCVLTGRL